MTDFSPLMLDWYKRNKRELPWRQTINPYFIWLSEIILQQTRVNQGLDYYLKFIEHYPTIFDLASADEQSVLTDWQGLGYYSRARNLHASSKMIVEKHQGVFPSTYNDLIQLKGIGPYTAAAISSFSFGEHRSVLDGNVFRVLSRLFDIDLPIDSTDGQKQFSQLAQDLLPNSDSATYNQAIMEFGALQCIPNNPDCLNCPIQHFCLAFKNQTVASRPVKSLKTKIKKRYFNYLLFENQGHLVLQKRNSKDIWQHLFEFPLIEMESPLIEHENELEKSLLQSYKKLPIKYLDLKKHILSHQHIFARIWIFEHIPTEYLNHNDYQIVSLIHLDQYPVPQLLYRFIENRYVSL